MELNKKYFNLRNYVQKAKIFYKNNYSLDNLLVKKEHPIFFHRPNGNPSNGITRQVAKDFNRLSKYVIRNKDNYRYIKPENLTFITYSNYKSKCLIEKCYEAYGIDDVIVVGKEFVQWNWMAKIKPVLTYLKSNSCDSKYIIATDGNDILMVNNPINIIDYFESYSCDVLFCNTIADWPLNKEYTEFEISKYYTHPFHCHLSAGGYIAKKDALIGFLGEIVQAFEEKQAWVMHKGNFDDQLGWRHLHYKYYPKIKVDYKSLIFKRYDLFKDNNN